VGNDKIPPSTRPLVLGMRGKMVKILL